MGAKKMRNLSLLPFVALSVLGVTALPAAATDRTDVEATVKNYAAAFNNSDKEAFTGLCAGQVIIIDDFPPYIFQGTSACSDFWDAQHLYDQNEQINSENVAVGKFTRISIADDRAYVVTPAVFSYKEKGKPDSSKGIWSLVLQKYAIGWRIAGWSWAQMNR